MKTEIKVNAKIEGLAKKTFLTLTEKGQKELIDDLSGIVHSYDKNHGMPTDKAAEVWVTLRLEDNTRYFHSKIILIANSAFDLDANVKELNEKTEEEYFKIVEEEKSM
ncbi:MAG: hypothetical protein ACJA1C_002176 [Crocinitomicaceae bacterium]|jgi:hypothetical protein